MKVNDAYAQWVQSPTPENRDALGEALFHYIKATIASLHGTKFYFLEDAIGEVAHKIFTNLSSFDGDKGAFSNWVYGIIYNTCIDMLRAKTYRQEQLLGDYQQRAEDSRVLDRLSLGTLINKLDSDDKKFIYLKMYGGSNQDACRMFDMKEEAVKKWWTRILGRLRTLGGGN